jgi:hypothetical protein
MRYFALTLGFSLGFLVGYFVLGPLMANAAPSYSVDEFIDNRDGTATLLVTCASGKELRFRVDRKRLDKLDEEGLYQIIKLECK